MLPNKENFDLHWQPVTETGCWIWDGPTKISKGEERGRIMFGGERMFAHRWAWTIYKGEILDGTQINHHCDQTLCVNPDHLYAGTQKENMLDASKRRRWPDRSGENNVKAKLTSEIVDEIRASNASAKEMAQKYAVTATHIYYIRSGKSWVKEGVNG